MTKDDSEQFRKVMASAFEMYGKSPSLMTMRIWWKCMADRFTIEQFENGMVQHLTCPDRGQYPPKPADIVAKLEGTREDRKDAGEYAWRRVMDALSSNGVYVSIAFDDPAIHYAIEVAFGSWEKVGKLGVDDPFPRKEFCTAYAAYRPSLPYRSYFPGVAEIHNAAEGLRCIHQSIALVGDENRVGSVMRLGRDHVGVDGEKQPVSTGSIGVMTRAILAEARTQ